MDVRSPQVRHAAAWGLHSAGEIRTTFRFVPPRAVAGSDSSSPRLAVGDSGPPKAFRGSVATSDPATGSPITNLSANSLTRGVPPVRAKPRGLGPPPSKFHTIDAMTGKRGQVFRAPFGILSTFPQPRPPLRRCLRRCLRRYLRRYLRRCLRRCLRPASVPRQLAPSPGAMLTGRAQRMRLILKGSPIPPPDCPNSSRSPGRRPTPAEAAGRTSTGQSYPAGATRLRARWLQRSGHRLRFVFKSVEGAWARRAVTPSRRRSRTRD